MTADEWIESKTGRRPIRRVRLPGGMSSRVERVDFDGAATLVLRQIEDVAWVACEPDLIEREVTALEVGLAGGLPVPRVIAADPHASELPAPSILTSFVDGDTLTGGRPLSHRVEAIADLVAAVHGLNPAGLPSWRPWIPENLDVPAWSGSPHLWGQAMEHVTGRSPGTGASFLHRDIQPMNLLWVGRGISGIVDWVNASVGHPHADLGHLRWNLAVLAGMEAANATLDAYLRISAANEYEPYWDLAAAVGLLPGPPGMEGWRSVGRTDLTADHVIRVTDAFVRAALRRC